MWIIKIILLILGLFNRTFSEQCRCGNNKNCALKVPVDSTFEHFSLQNACLKDFRILSNITVNKILILSNNNIQNITVPVSCRGVKQLVLDRNNITHIPHLPLTRLMIINLNHNQIRSVDQNAFQNTTQLISLYLENNRIVNLNFIGNLMSLTRLYLSNNIIDSVDNFNNSILPKVKHIDISYNRIEHVDFKVFSSCTNLTTIYLDNNNIKYVKGCLRKNIKINLENNEINQLPLSTDAGSDINLTNNSLFCWFMEDFKTQSTYKITVGENDTCIDDERPKTVIIIKNMSANEYALIFAGITVVLLTCGVTILVVSILYLSYKPMEPAILKRELPPIPKTCEEDGYLVPKNAKEEISPIYELI